MVPANKSLFVFQNHDGYGLMNCVGVVIVPAVGYNDFHFDCSGLIFFEEIVPGSSSRHTIVDKNGEVLILRTDFYYMYCIYFNFQIKIKSLLHDT